MKAPSFARALVAGACALALVATPAFGQGSLPRGIDYVTGGVTKDEADEFAALVQVRIVDQRGGVVLEVPAADPILLVNVPPGRYTIEATLDGQSKRHTVNVGSGRAQTTFVW